MPAPTGNSGGKDCRPNLEASFPPQTLSAMPCLKL